MNKTNLSLLILAILLLTTTILPSNAEAVNLHNFMTERSMDVNRWYCRYRSELTVDDAITLEQAQNRSGWIIKYAYDLNYLHPEIHPRRVAKDFFAIVELESHFVNYYDMDNGRSFGMTALTWQTAQAASDFFGDGLKLYGSSKNINHKELLRSDVEKQVKYGIWYYYKLLKRYYNGDRLSAIVGYNVGPGLDVSQKKKREYFFKAIGRISYYEMLFKEY